MVVNNDEKEGDQVEIPGLPFLCLGYTLPMASLWHVLTFHGRL